MSKKRGSVVQKQNAMFKNTSDQGGQGAQNAGVLYKSKTQPLQKPGRDKDQFQKNNIKANIDFSDACKKHDSGTVGGCDLRHLSIKTLTFCELRKSRAEPTQFTYINLKE